MPLIADPNQHGQTPYDVLELPEDASRNAITAAYARARRDRSKSSQILSRAHEQLTRAAARLRVDLLLYEVPSVPEPVVAALPPVDPAAQPLPLPAPPVAELVDLNAILAALPAATSAAAAPPAEPPPLPFALPVRFDR